MEKIKEMYGYLRIMKMDQIQQLQYNHLIQEYSFIDLQNHSSMPTLITTLMKLSMKLKKLQGRPKLMYLISRVIDLGMIQVLENSIHKKL